MRYLCCLFIVFCGGSAVGIGIIAMYSVFDFLCVLRMDATGSRFEQVFEACVLFGSLSSLVLYFNYAGQAPLSVPLFALVPIGTLFGVSVGLLAASLTDVTGIIPVLKIKLPSISLFLVGLSMTLGRLGGSLYFFHMKNLVR